MIAPRRGPTSRERRSRSSTWSRTSCLARQGTERPCRWNGLRELEARIAFIFGAREEVERIEQYHRDYNVVEHDAPLHGTRGLFRTNG